MAEKHRLRRNRARTIINLTSKQQESELGQALAQTVVMLAEKFDLKMTHRRSIPLDEIVQQMRKNFPEVDFMIPLRVLR